MFIEMHVGDETHRACSAGNKMIDMTKEEMVSKALSRARKRIILIIISLVIIISIILFLALKVFLFTVEYFHF